MNAPLKIFIACPTYPGGGGPLNVAAQLRAIARHHDWIFHRMDLSLSLLTANFNSMWARALSLRETGQVTHFLLLHADVVPRGDNWLDVLLGEMHRAEADVVSAIIPIKDARGLTSTALDRTGNVWRPERLTVIQARHEHPVTWTAPDLLVNTGCLLVDFGKPWVERICFTIRDRITRRPDGRWVAESEPEDWNFSRQCHALGVKVFATRAVTVDHYGIGCWSSDNEQGWLADHQNLALAAERPQP